MEETKVSESFVCLECNKNYSSYKSLWNHNKKFHQKKEKVKEYICKNCNKSFDNKQNKYYHQKNCKETPHKKSTDELSNETKTTNTNITTINNNTNSNNNNKIINSNNKTIIINNYNNDNLEYISEKFKDRLFDNLLSYSEMAKQKGVDQQSTKINSSTK